MVWYIPSRMFFSLCLASALSFADPRADLLDLLGGEWVSSGIYAAAKLDVAGHLIDGPKSIDTLAKELNVNEEALYRVLSMLSSRGVFAEKEGKYFSNSAMSERLSETHPESLRSLAIFYGEEIRNSFHLLLDAVATGKPSFDNFYHEPVFTYFKNHPDRASLFQSAMSEKSKAVIQSVIAQVDFQGTVCDVGGGKGHLLQALLNAHSELKGINFDLPEVIASLPSPIPRMNFEGGSFFESIPYADVYLMKSILHDWSDEKALEILHSCHASMPKHAFLYIIEPVLVPSKSPDYARLTDVVMLAVTGGRERTLDQYRELLMRAGFHLHDVFSTPTEFKILKASIQKK